MLPSDSPDRAQAPPAASPRSNATDPAPSVGERSAPLLGGSGPSVPSTASDIFDSVLQRTSELYRGSREVLRESYLPSRLPHLVNQIREVA